MIYILFHFGLINFLSYGHSCGSFSMVPCHGHIMFVTTLALGSKPRQGFTRMWAKRKTQECGRVWKCTLTLPSELPFWELESRWTPETSKSDCNAQNPSPWRVIYIIGKLLKRRCPKWARMTHLDICNTSYDQKKGRKSNWQFDSRPWKVRNWLDYLTCRWRVTLCWKTLDEGYNFGSDLIPIGGLHKKLWFCKVVKVPTLAISGLAFWEFRDKKPFGWNSRREVQSILYGGRWWLPLSLGRGESYESEVARGSS
jgi:hypothetical protein